MNLTSKILYFIFFSILIFVFKPQFIFKTPSSFREFGIGVDSEGYDKTLFNILTVNLIVVAILVSFK